jgi:ribonuclease HI
MNKIYVFTDGSCINNGKKNADGAIGIFFSDSNPNNYSQAITQENSKITNQTMELLGCIKALQIIINKQMCKMSDIIYICTDSSYVINCMTKWYQLWNKNGWKTTAGKDVENIDLIKLLYDLKSKYITIFKHVTAHREAPTDDKDTDEYKLWYGNHMADKLATTANRENIANNMIENKDVVIKKNKTNNKKNVQNSLNI